MKKFLSIVLSLCLVITSMPIELLGDSFISRSFFIAPPGQRDCLYIASDSNKDLKRKVEVLKKLFGEHIINDELDLNYDFQQYVEEHRRKVFLRGNKGGKEPLLWLPDRVNLASLLRCPAQCPHCFYGKKINITMSIEEMMHVFDMTDIYIQNPTIHLSGGEVTLRNDLMEIIETFPINSLVTNASTMTSQAKANKFVKDLKKALIKRLKTSKHTFNKPLSNKPLNGYQRKLAAYAMFKNQYLRDESEDFYYIDISLDDIHLQQNAISVVKIANLIKAIVDNFPEMHISFIVLKGLWLENAYPALKKELKKRSLNLTYKSKDKQFLLTGKAGLKKHINFQENKIDRAGNAIYLPKKYFYTVNLKKHKNIQFGRFGYITRALIDPRGNMTIFDIFQSDHSPLVFGNPVIENWLDIIQRLDKDPLFRKLYEQAIDILPIAQELHPTIVSDIQKGKPGDIGALFYWLLSNPERKLYVTYRLLKDYYEKGILNGKNPFKGLSKDQIKQKVQREVKQLRRKFLKLPSTKGSHDISKSL